MKQTAKRFFSLALSVLLVLAALLSLSSCAKHPVAYIAIEEYGLVAVELYEDKAPITVANFTKLVEEDFYDGLTFHRIIKSFMIQGGDPNGDGSGGSDEKIKGEFYYNGIDTGLTHVEGTISMARSGCPLTDSSGVSLEEYLYAGYDIPSGYMPYLESAFNSASSQFFIVTETSSNNTASLDGKYAAFGQVVEGMDVVKAVAAVETNASNAPLTKVKIAVITFDRAEAEAALQK